MVSKSTPLKRKVESKSDTLKDEIGLVLKINWTSLKDMKMCLANAISFNVVFVLIYLDQNFLI